MEVQGITVYRVRIDEGVEGRLFLHRYDNNNDGIEKPLTHINSLCLVKHGHQEIIVNELRHVLMSTVT